MLKQKHKTIHTKSGGKNVNENGKLFTCEQSENAKKKKKANYETIHTKREKKGSVK